MFNRKRIAKLEVKVDNLQEEIHKLNYLLEHPFEHKIGDDVLVPGYHPCIVIDREVKLYRFIQREHPFDFDHINKFDPHAVYHCVEYRSGEKVTLEM